MNLSTRCPWQENHFLELFLDRRLGLLSNFSMLSVRSRGESSPSSWSFVPEVCVSHPSASMAASLSASCLFLLGFPANCIPLNSTMALNSLVLRCFVLYLGGVWPALISRVWSRLLGFIPSLIMLPLVSSLLLSLALLVSRPNTNLPSHRSPAASSCAAYKMYFPSLWMSKLGSSSWSSDWKHRRVITHDWYIIDAEEFDWNQEKKNTARLVSIFFALTDDVPQAMFQYQISFQVTGNKQQKVVSLSISCEFSPLFLASTEGGQI